MSLSETAIRRPVATVMFFLGIIILGVISLTRLSVDLLPDLSYPRLTIWTSYAEATPQEVEELVTARVEEALSTVPRVRKLHSISKEGVSLVMMEFLWGTNMDIAALNVREKLDNVRWSIPRAAGRPTILRLDPRSQPILHLAIAGEELMALKELARNVFKRRLEQIDGVALATVTGGFEREIHVEVDQQKLVALGITIDQVSAAIAGANRNLPGGTIRKGRYRFSLRTLGEFETVPEIHEVVVGKNINGSVITLNQIASVIDGFKERDAITRFNGKEAIGLIVTKEAGANTVEVARRVRKVLAQLTREYPEVQIHIAVDQSEFISQAISNVLQAVVFGGILAFLVLFFFLHDFRSPLNIATAIPIAILATFALMYFSHISLNMISLGGLALGVGMLVDNSIVVLENIFRHRQEGKDRLTAGILGANEVAMPVTASTLTTVAVFFPIVYVKGVAGQLFRDQSLTVTFSLLASLLVSLTLLPMLASRFFHRNRNTSSDSAGTEASLNRDLYQKDQKKPRRFHRLRNLFYRLNLALAAGISTLRGFLSALINYWLQGLQKYAGRFFQPLFFYFDRWFAVFAARYEKLLQWALDHRKKTLTIVVFCLAGALLLGLTLDRRLMPKLEQRQFTVNLTMPPGTSLSMTAAAVAIVEKQLLSQPEVLTVFSQIGLTSSQTTLLLEESALNHARIQVGLKKNGRSMEKFINSVRPLISRLGQEDLHFETGQSILSQFLGAAESDVAIKISGNDFAVSLKLMDEIRKHLQSVAGLTDLRSSYEEGRPEIRITIDREKIGQFGVTAQQIADFVKNRMYGIVATQFKDFDRKIDILIRPINEQRDEITDLLNAELLVQKKRIPLRYLIHTQISQGPVAIQREDQVRQVVLYGNVQGRGFSSVMRDIEKQLSAIHVPYNYQITVGGQQEEMQRSFKSLLLVFILALLLVYMILAAQFESLVHPFIIMFSVPLSLIGVVFTLFVTGQSFNIMSLIGIVVLVGIVVNDAIIKVDFINQGRKAGLNMRQAIEEAGKKRLRPIVMTTVTTVLGLLPMALGIGEGAELRRPLALAVIGGLTAATFLTLIVVPVLYSVFVKEE